jgi:hypothetical protein
MLKRIRTAWFDWRLNKLRRRASDEYGRETTKSRHPAFVGREAYQLKHHPET